MSFQVILVVHVLLSLGLVALILMQHGKGADAGAAFGAGASGSVFGARGANSFIYKLTASIAIGFFLTSLTLAYLATNENIGASEKPKSIVEEALANEPLTADVPSIDTKTNDIPK